MSKIFVDAFEKRTGGTEMAVPATGKWGATQIADGSVTDAEYQYINTLSSNAQTQIDAKLTSSLSTDQTWSGSQRGTIVTDNDGSFDEFKKNTISIGKELPISLDLIVGHEITLMSTSNLQTPFGNLPLQEKFKISSVFSTGLAEFDQNVIFMPF